MKRFFFVVCLSLTALSFGEIYISDMTWGEEISYFDGEPLLIYFVDSFTVSARNTFALSDPFFLGTRYPLGDAGAINLYYDNYNIPNTELWRGLDVNLRWQLPQEITVLNNAISVSYWGNETGFEDLWLVYTASPFTTIEAGPLIKFSYVPEPGTVVLFGLGGVMLRKKVKG